MYIVYEQCSKFVEFERSIKREFISTASNVLLNTRRLDTVMIFRIFDTYDLGWRDIGFFFCDIGWL